MDRVSPYSTTVCSFCSGGVIIICLERTLGGVLWKFWYVTHSLLLSTRPRIAWTFPFRGCTKCKFCRWSEFLSVTFFLSTVFTKCFNWTRTSIWQKSQGHFSWRLLFSDVFLDILGHFSGEPSIYTSADFCAYNIDLTTAAEPPMLHWFYFLTFILNSIYYLLQSYFLE